MAHRLLHTLVVSSTLLLDGCGSPSAAETTAPPPVLVTSGDDGANARNGETPTPVAAAGSGTGALAMCEAGWPTTKGSSCSVDTSGVTVCCNSFDPTSASNCCVQPQDPPR